MTKNTVCLDSRAHCRGINDITWMHAAATNPIIVSASDDSTIRVHDVHTVWLGQTKSITCTSRLDFWTMQDTNLRTVEDLDIAYTLCTHSTQNIVFGGTTSEFFKMWDFRLPHPCICVIHAHNDTVSSISCSQDGLYYIWINFMDFSILHILLWRKRNMHI